MKEKRDWLGVVHTVKYYINQWKVNMFSLFLGLEHNEIKEALLLWKAWENVRKVVFSIRTQLCSENMGYLSLINCYLKKSVVCQIAWKHTVHLVSNAIQSLENIQVKNQHLFSSVCLTLPSAFCLSWYSSHMGGTQQECVVSAS